MHTNDRQSLHAICISYINSKALVTVFEQAEMHHIKYSTPDNQDPPVWLYLDKQAGHSVFETRTKN